MGPLIRAAPLAAVRRRLPGAAAPALAEKDAARREIEQQVREELARDLRQIVDAERQRAYAEGHATGLAQGRADAATELAQERGKLTQQVSGALAALEQAHEVVMDKLESSVGEVVFAVVCRLLNGQLTSRSLVLDIVAQTCSLLRTDTSATARLHPRDIETLRELTVGEELQIQGVKLKLIPDESLRLGGCVIESSSGQFDGGLESQLRRLHAVLGAADEGR